MKQSNVQTRDSTVELGLIGLQMKTCRIPANRSIDFPSMLSKPIPMILEKRNKKRRLKVKVG